MEKKRMEKFEILTKNELYDINGGSIIYPSMSSKIIKWLKGLFK
ncbi:TPA: hypothetical protein ACGO8I_002016 [Streptococcus suis]